MIELIINIRNINDTDHYEIELVAKRAFWNLNMPGCDERYLVHRLWNEPCPQPLMKKWLVLFCIQKPKLKPITAAKMF